MDKPKYEVEILALVFEYMRLSSQNVISGTDIETIEQNHKRLKQIEEMLEKTPEQIRDIALKNRFV